MILGIHHVAISTPDLDRLTRFYVEHLGFEIAYRNSWSKGLDAIDALLAMKDTAARMAMLRAGNLYVEVFQYENPAPKPQDPDRPAADHGYTHFCLTVTDIMGEYERLKQAGMRFHAPPSQRAGVGHIATYGRDCDGNIIELLEFLDDGHAFHPHRMAIGRHPTVA